MWLPFKYIALGLLSTTAAKSNDTETEVVIAKRGIQWPTRVMAPYIMLMKWPAFDVSDCMAKTGHKFYTLAFIIR